MNFFKGVYENIPGKNSGAKKILPEKSGTLIHHKYFF